MRLRELVGDLRQDLHYALRTLRRDIAFTVFAVAIIALGIGASATVFSVASALLLRPLPFAQPDRLVWIQNGKRFQRGQLPTDDSEFFKSGVSFAPEPVAYR